MQVIISGDTVESETNDKWLIAIFAVAVVLILSGFAMREAAALGWL